MYFIREVWDYMFLKTLKEKQNLYMTHSDSIFKVILRDTSFLVQDVWQVNISGDWYEIYM